MLDNIFEARNKSLEKVIKAGHYLARSLRENVELFSYNSDTKKVAFLTESKKIVTGVLNPGKLTKVSVQDADTYLDESKFNTKIGNQITSWLSNLYEDKLVEAEDTFDNILESWIERSKLDKLTKLLEHKTNLVSYNKDIIKTKEVAKLVESIPLIVNFLKENKEKIAQVPQIRNGVILSNTVAHAFGMPKISYDDLAKNKSYTLNENESSSTLFSLITKQELIRSELLESKRSFDTIWHTNKNIVKLANAINSDEADVHSVLAEAITDVPYFALLSKKQITEMFDAILNSGDSVVDLKDIQKYSSYLFECKKEVKNGIVQVLNEKYGINIQNLKDPITYRSLINTQVVIFESIKRLLPKDSVCRPVLKDVISLLKERSGVEAIDVNNILREIFTKAEYSYLSESMMSKYLNFDEIAMDLGNVANVLKMIKGGMGGDMGGGMPQLGMPGGGAPQPSMQPPMQSGMGQPAQPQMGQQPTGQPQIGKPGMPQMGGDSSEEDLNTQGLTPDDDENGIMPETPMETPPMEMGGGNLAASLAELEELINGLKVKLGEDPDGDEMSMDGGMEPDGDEEFGSEEGDEGEGFEDGEDEDGAPDIEVNGGDGDDEIHVDKVKGSHDMDTDDDEESAESKPEPKPKKEKSGKPDFKKGKK